MAFQFFSSVFYIVFSTESNLSKWPHIRSSVVERKQTWGPAEAWKGASFSDYDLAPQVEILTLEINLSHFSNSIQILLVCKYVRRSVGSTWSIKLAGAVSPHNVASKERTDGTYQHK